MVPHGLKNTTAVCLLVVVLLVSTLGVFSVPQTVYAREEIIGEFLFCAGTALAEVAFAFGIAQFTTLVPTIDIPEILKESVKDCAAWVIANEALEQITAEVTHLSNTGFNGNPFYVRSIGNLLQQTADKQFIGLIESGEFENLPSTYKNEIALSLIHDYNLRNDFGARMTSTINHELYDLDAYIAGDFSQGGWDTWFKLTQVPQNNRLGAFLLAQDELDRRVAAKQTQKEQEVISGRGFLNQEVCEDVDSGKTKVTKWDDSAEGAWFDEETGECHNCIALETEPILENVCKNVTPGSVIQESLQKSLGSNVDRIVQADELNEALSALFRGLLSNLLGRDDGLYGIGEYIGEASSFTDIDLEELGDGDSGAGVFDISCTSGNPGSKMINISIPNFDVTSSSKEYRVTLPLDGHYPKANLVYDFFTGQNMRPNAIENWQFSYQLRASGGWFASHLLMENASIMMLFGNAIGKTDWVNKTAGWINDTWYHIDVIYDAGKIIETIITERDTGNVVSVMTSVPSNSIHPANGKSVDLILGENGDPILGTKYENLTLSLEPGTAVCAGNPDGPGPKGDGFGL